jgi:hypothetical protein
MAWIRRYARIFLCICLAGYFVYWVVARTNTNPVGAIGIAWLASVTGLLVWYFRAISDSSERPSQDERKVTKPAMPEGIQVLPGPGAKKVHHSHKRK